MTNEERWSKRCAQLREAKWNKIRLRELYKAAGGGDVGTIRAVLNKKLIDPTLPQFWKAVCIALKEQNVAASFYLLSHFFLRYGIGHNDQDKYIAEAFSVACASRKASLSLILPLARSGVDAELLDSRRLHPLGSLVKQRKFWPAERLLEEGCVFTWRDAEICSGSMLKDFVDFVKPYAFPTLAHNALAAGVIMTGDCRYRGVDPEAPLEERLQSGTWAEIIAKAHSK